MIVDIVIALALFFFALPLVLYVVVLCVGYAVALAVAPFGLVALAFKRKPKRVPEPVVDRSHRRGFYTLEQMDRGEHLPVKSYRRAAEDK